VETERWSRRPRPEVSRRNMGKSSHHPLWKSSITTPATKTIGYKKKQTAKKAMDDAGNAWRWKTEVETSNDARNTNAAPEARKRKEKIFIYQLNHAKMLDLLTEPEDKKISNISCQQLKRRAEHRVEWHHHQLKLPIGRAHKKCSGRQSRP